MSRHRLLPARPDAGTVLLAPVDGGVDGDGARHRAPVVPAPRPAPDVSPTASAAAHPAGRAARHAARDSGVALVRTADLAAASTASRGDRLPSPSSSSLHRRPDGGDADATAVRSAGRHRDAGSDRAGAARSAGSRHAAAPRAGSRHRGALVLVTITACLLALPTVSSAAADRCRWQRAAQALFLALDGKHDSRSTALRDALTDAGVGRDLPAECTRATTGTAGSPTSTASGPTTSRPSPTRGTPAPSSTATTSVAAPAPSTGGAPAATGTGSTAAAAFGWGTPIRSDDFTAGLSGWGVYNGQGHDGNGRRTSAAVKVANGLLTITGDGNGNSGGMAWGDGRKFGRYEARVRSTVGDESYHPVMLLWPDAENWPVGGEVDWMEISSADRQDADTFLHFGADNDQVHGNVSIDATQWHNWAVEWSPRGVTTYVDGKAWWSSTNTRILPPGPMHMTIQLDFFGGGNPKTSQMQVDWVKQYGV